MTQEKHTPLPWVIIQVDTERLEIDQNLVRATAAILIGKYGYRMTIEGATSEEEFMANLNLIAAAPKLLRALGELITQALEDLPFDERTVHFDTAIDDARKAIAEARAS